MLIAKINLYLVIATTTNKTEKGEKIKKKEKKAALGNRKKKSALGNSKKRSALLK